eukprot:sb/3474411/
MDTLLVRIKERQLQQNTQVAELFGEHFRCMVVDVVNLKNSSMVLIQKDAPTEEETSATLSEETLIVIVSVISAVTIVVALVFFLIVVRRTFVKSSSGQRSMTAHTDLLTAQQYVSFLQKNGYANPTCRLPQKYLNEKD